MIIMNTIFYTAVIAVMIACLDIKLIYKLPFMQFD